MYLFNFNLPILMCNLEDQVAAMLNAYNNTDCPTLDPLCFLDEGSDFKNEWRDCLLGELTAEEQVWSDRMTRAWVNFAIHGYGII